MRKTFLYMISAVLLAASCNSAMIEDPVQYGTLSVSLAGEPGIEVVTRAEENESVDLDAFKIYASSSASAKLLGTYGSLKNSTELIRLQAGDYIIYAENCNATEAESGNGCKRMYGNDDVTISAGTPSEAEISCAVANARISVTFDASVDDKFGENELTVTFIGSDPERKVTATQDSKGPFWFNADQIVKYTISAGNVTYVSDCSIKIDKDKNPVELAPKDNFELKISVSESADGTLSLTPSVNKTVEKVQIPAGFNPYN